jgi:N-acetylmuramoyl-L-alanine amidase
MTEEVADRGAATHALARLGQLVVKYFDAYRPAARRIATRGNVACPDNPFGPQRGGPLSGRTIVLDPGHGGRDPGAAFIAPSGTVLKEKTVVLDIARRLAHKLRRRGATVYLTRCLDVYSSLEARAAFSNSVDPDLLVSVHLNGSDDPTRDGTSVYYLARGDKALATRLLGSSEVPGLWAALNRQQPLFKLGISQVRYTLLAFSRAPSVLSESVFITSASEASALRGASRRERVAEGHLIGILGYFRQGS